MLTFALPTLDSRAAMVVACASAAAVAASATTIVYLEWRRRSQDGDTTIRMTPLTKRQFVESAASDDGERGRKKDAMTLAEFRVQGHAMVDWICEYRAGAHERPVRCRVAPDYLRALGFPEEAPFMGEPWETIMGDIDRLIVPGLTHWESPRFAAYFKPHASLASVLGELMCAGLNVMGFSWIASPACTELEVHMMDWLARLLDLPAGFLSGSGEYGGGGVIQGSAGEAIICCLLAARARAAEGLEEEEAAARWSRMTVYTSDQAHSIVQNACMILGIPLATRFRVIKTHRRHGFRLQAAALRKRIKADVRDGFLPLFVVATTGTTSSTAVDDVESIAGVCAEHGLWLHVDAAYGGAYRVCPEFRAETAGVRLADSYVVNLHKKLLVNFDCAAMWVAHRRHLLAALSLTPEYLRNKASESGAVVDFKDWQLPLGRRFRALKVWFVLRSFGVRGLREHVRRSVALAQRFEAAVEESVALEMAVPRGSMALVCFRLALPAGTPADQVRRLNATLLDDVNETGKTFIIHTVLDEDYVLRFAAGGVEQTFEDVDDIFNVIEECAENLLKVVKATGPA